MAKHFSFFKTCPWNHSSTLLPNDWANKLIFSKDRPTNLHCASVDCPRRRRARKLAPKSCLSIEHWAGWTKLHLPVAQLCFNSQRVFQLEIEENHYKHRANDGGGYASLGRRHLLFAVIYVSLSSVLLVDPWGWPVGSQQGRFAWFISF